MISRKNPSARFLQVTVLYRSVRRDDYLFIKQVLTFLGVIPYHFFAKVLPYL